MSSFLFENNFREKSLPRLWMFEVWSLTGSRLSVLGWNTCRMKTAQGIRGKGKTTSGERKTKAVTGVFVHLEYLSIVNSSTTPALPVNAFALSVMPSFFISVCKYRYTCMHVIVFFISKVIIYSTTIN